MWTANFRKLCLINAMLFASLFIDTQWCSSFQLFFPFTIMLGLCLPGPFLAYLSDSFRRKYVCATGLVLMYACFFGLNYIDATLYVALICVLQGVGLGLSTGMLVTLSVDVVASEFRSRANACYLLSTCLGMFAGFLLSAYPIRDIAYIWFLWGGLGLMLTLSMRIPFRAPLELSYCSLDRFLLPRALPLMLNVVPLGVLLALVCMHITQPMRAACVCLSFFMGFAVDCSLRRLSPLLRGAIGVSGLFICSLLCCFYTYSGWVDMLLLLLLGMCLLLTLLSLLQLFLGLTQHCQRATANYSYLLSLLLGVFLGIFYIGRHYEVSVQSMLLYCSLAALLLFGTSSLYYKKIRG